MGDGVGAWLGGAGFVGAGFVGRWVGAFTLCAPSVRTVARGLAGVSRLVKLRLTGVMVDAASGAALGLVGTTPAAERAPTATASVATKAAVLAIK